MFANFKLRGRIFVGFSIPVLLICGFSGLVYSIGNRVSETFKQVNRAQEVLVQTDEMVLRTSMMARQVRGYLLVKGQDPLREFEKQRQRYQKAVAVVDKLIVYPGQRETFKRMVQMGEQYEDMCRETLRLADAGKQKEAVNLYLTESKKLVGGLDRLGEEFNQKEQEILVQYTKDANSSIQFLILSAVLTALLSLALSGAAAYLIWSTIAKTNRTINQTVNSIVSSSAEIAATVEQQEHTATQQAVYVNQTTTTMTELSASSRTSAEQAESAAENVRQVLGLAESSAVGARQVLSLAESSAGGARQLLNLAEGGNKAVEKTQEEMSVLKQKVGAIAEQILHLSEQTNQIGTITNIVTDLANQTNMLALNAAVEAVRAGEHGKGFGVVASEIRKLADESKKSAQKINSLVIGIQSAIDSTVKVTDEGRKTAEEGIKLSRETAESFNSVTVAIEDVILKSSTGVAEAINDVVLNNQQTTLTALNDVVVNNQQISLTAKQQAIAIEQVVEAMNSVNQGAVQTASGISQTKIGVQKLNEAAHSLKALV